MDSWAEASEVAECHFPYPPRCLRRSPLPRRRSRCRLWRPYCCPCRHVTSCLMSQHRKENVRRLYPSGFAASALPYGACGLPASSVSSPGAPARVSWALPGQWGHRNTSADVRCARVCQDLSWCSLSSAILHDGFETRPGKDKGDSH